MTPYEWVMLVLFVVSTAYSLTHQPKTVTPRPAAFEDFEFPQFEEGTEQHVIFGDCWTESWMVLGLGNYRTKKIKTSSGK